MQTFKITATTTRSTLATLIAAEAGQKAINEPNEKKRIVVQLQANGASEVCVGDADCATATTPVASTVKPAGIVLTTKYDSETMEYTRPSAVYVVADASTVCTVKITDASAM